jgi:hypothetical protein
MPNTVQFHRTPEREACVLGWQESLTLLANPVEAAIPD